VKPPFLPFFPGRAMARRAIRAGLEMDVAEAAFATARDQTTISESSLSPRASTSPNARQISLGRNPTRISTR